MVCRMTRWLLPLLLLPALAYAQPIGNIPYSALPNCADTSGQHLNSNQSTGAISCGTSSSGGGGGALSALTAATGANTIGSGDNAQTWNWTLTTAAKSAFVFGETAAATNGAGNQFLLDVDTLAASTAGPLRVKAQGNTLLTLSNQGALTYTAPAQTVTNGNGLAINLTAGAANGSGLGGAINITGGAIGSATAAIGGAVTIAAGPSNANVTSSQGGPITVQGGASTVTGNGTGGTALFAGGDTNGANGSGGATTLRAGDGAGGNNSSGGALTIRSGGGCANCGGSGNLTLQTPNQMNGNSNSGTLTISTGTTGNGNTLGTPGDITITAGSNNAASGTGWNVNGANIKLNTGNGGWQNSNGGDVVITLGAKLGTGRNGVLKVTSLPTADPGVAGALWLPATGAVAVSGTTQGAGVSCTAGTVSTTTMVVTNGIVTHC